MVNMLPKINGKSFTNANEEDLKLLIGNTDYRENEHIDYKLNFSFLEVPKGKEKNEKISEFKSDVCSFANAEGGYLIFGVSDIDGCASELVGIDIENTDKFELDRRNNLGSIQPKVPYIKFHFVKLENGKYIVIIFIKHDTYAPYAHVEDEKNYKLYKRTGNRKQTMTYTEIKNMFNQSLYLDKEIMSYRTERIRYYNEQEDDEENTYSKFLLLHIIPETFMDSNYSSNMFAMEKNMGCNFKGIFSNFSCSSFSIPCVDGLRFVPTSNSDPHAECFVYNNQIVECFYPLNHIIHISPQYPNGYLACGYLWQRIKDAIYKYFEVFSNILKNQKVYVCISIIGCKGILSTTEGEAFWSFYKGIIDRNKIICPPIDIENIDSDEQEQLLLKKLYVNFMLSVGRKNDDHLNEYIKDVYHSEV